PSRSDAIRLLDHAYEYNDYLALLRLEVKHLAHDATYLAKQNDEKLHWYIVALQCAFAEALAEQQYFRGGDPYSLFELYRGMGGDEAAFVELCEGNSTQYRHLTDMLQLVYGVLSDDKRPKRQVLADAEA